MLTSRGGEKSGSIGVADGLRLMYGVTAHDGTKIGVDELIPLCLHGDQVWWPAAMADVHQVRSVLLRFTLVIISVADTAAG
jgi:hypothetical protein